MDYAGFVGPSYTLQNISADCQRCVNLYPQPDESGSGKNRSILLSTPGLTKVADLTGTAKGPTRCNYESSKGRMFSVVGNYLFELSSTYAVLGSYVLPGETGTGQVSITDNGRDMLILTGPNGYWFNFAANTLTQVTDAVFEGGTQCGFIDGYVIFNQPNSQQFWITDLYSTTIDPLGFASAEGQPDILMGTLVDHREIWLFSSTHTEVWYDAGGLFPFSYIQGAYISHGIASPWTAVRLDNTVFWVGQDEFGTAIAWRANGYAPLRVSTFAVEQAWQRYPKGASDAVAWTYQQDGHAFYVLNFPSGDATWAYDAATGLWHERAYLGTLTFNDGQLHRGRANNHCFAFGAHLVGDWETGYIYQLSPAALDDDTREIQRMRRAPYIDNQKKRIFFHQFELDMEVGQGNPGNPANPEPVIPLINLRWSDDGGYKWSSYYTISMGKSGQYRQRVIWRRLGQSRGRVFETTTAQNFVGLSMYNAYLELEGVNS